MANDRPYSSLVVDGVEQAPSRAMLYPTGFKTEDFSKPQIGILGDFLEGPVIQIARQAF